MSDFESLGSSLYNNEERDAQPVLTPVPSVGSDEEAELVPFVEPEPIGQASDEDGDIESSDEQPIAPKKKAT